MNCVTHYLTMLKNVFHIFGTPPSKNKTSINTGGTLIRGFGFMNLKGWNVMRLIDADNLKRTLSASDNIPWLKGIPVTDVYINKQLGIDVGDISFDRLAEICEAEREGELVVLPCKVGDTVYYPKINRYRDILTNNYYKALQSGFISAIYLKRDSEWIVDILIGSYHNAHSFKDFGKSVFLTREEAKKTLAEMEDDDEN